MNEPMEHIRKDPYRYVATIYDRLFNSMNKGLRLVGLRMYHPAPNSNILDVGCGTGAHLELYSRDKCNLYGLDSSAAMLEVARKRLDDAATLDLCDATRMIYEDDKFDLILSMLTMHEMLPHVRSQAMCEMKRVLKENGRLIVIDFNPGIPRSLQGWLSKAIIILSELAAGRDHYMNYRHFISHGGLPTLLIQHDLTMEKKHILAGGTFLACLAA
ncbi:MAG: hypothetical protein A2Y54_05075 [Chloroflexi bacterium RBG_16_51_16]|nr:MAG: hypothetical protein A2Y54_05075 [Chloroflexi bacterium RBG_16_51_16]